MNERGKPDIGSLKKILFAPAVDEKHTKSFYKKVKAADILIIGIHNLTAYPGKNFGITPYELDMITELS